MHRPRFASSWCRWLPRVISDVLVPIFLLQTGDHLRRVEAAACAATTYNDGYITFGSSNYLTISTTTGITLGGGASFTIEMWVRRTTVNSNTFWLGIGDQSDTTGTDKYLHMGQRGDNKPSLAFWGNDDFNFGTAYSDTAWHHWAFRYTGTSKARRIFRDGSDLGVSATGTSGEIAGGHFSVTTGLKIRIGGIVNGLQNKFQGDLDELMMFNSALTAGIIASHFQGNYWNMLTPAGGCMLWLRFNEGTEANAVDSCNTANIAVWTGTQGWTQNNVQPACVSGYWKSWLVEVVKPSVRVGLSASVKVHQLDQYGVKMNTYADPPAASVSISVTGGTGTSLPSSMTLLSMSSGEGTFTFTNNQPETVSFQLTDTANNGRSVSITYPNQTFYTGDVTAISFSAQTQRVTYTPNLNSLHYSYTTQSIPLAASTIDVTIAFSQALSINLNGAPTGLLIGSNVPTSLSLNQGVNTIEIISNEGTDGIYTYTFTITRRGPDVTNILLHTNPSYASLTPSFVNHQWVTRIVSIPGILSTLTITATFTYPGTVTVTLNGISFGTLVSGTPKDLSWGITAGAGPNTLLVTSTEDGQTHTYQLGTACPAPFKCWPAVPNSGCAYTCQYCTGTTYRTVCLLDRPACCGSVGCQC